MSAYVYRRPGLGPTKPTRNLGAASSSSQPNGSIYRNASIPCLVAGQRCRGSTEHALRSLHGLLAHWNCQTYDERVMADLYPACTLRLDISVFVARSRRRVWIARALAEHGVPSRCILRQGYTLGSTIGVASCRMTERRRALAVTDARQKPR
jgi:hypothetical protein